MEIKIREYEEQIAKLEKKVSDLEIHNSGLRECLLKNIQFSTKLSNITYEMDCLLEKKGKEIRNLEKKLEESVMKLSQLITQEILMEFDIKLEIANDVPSVPESTNSEFNVNDYVVAFPTNKLQVKRNSDGDFKCTECDYKTPQLNTYEAHFRRHTDEKPFQCKLCERTFVRKGDCIDHIRGHDDRFKLQCTVCDAKFIKRQALINHTETWHNGEGYERKRRRFKSGTRKLDEKKTRRIPKSLRCQKINNCAL